MFVVLVCGWCCVCVLNCVVIFFMELLWCNCNCWLMLILILVFGLLMCCWCCMCCVIFLWIIMLLLRKCLVLKCMLKFFIRLVISLCIIGVIRKWSCMVWLVWLCLSIIWSVCCNVVGVCFWLLRLIWWVFVWRLNCVICCLCFSSWVRKVSFVICLWVGLLVWWIGLMIWCWKVRVCCVCNWRKCSVWLSIMIIVFLKCCWLCIDVLIYWNRIIFVIWDIWMLEVVSDVLFLFV